MATRFQLLPDVVDVTFVFASAGGLGTFLTVAGACLQCPPERLARLALLGQTIGFCLGAVALIVGLVSR